MKPISFKIPTYLHDEITALAHSAQRQKVEEMTLRLEASLARYPALHTNIRELEKLKFLLQSKDFSQQNRLKIPAHLHQSLKSASNLSGHSMAMEFVYRIQHSVRERSV